MKKHEEPKNSSPFELWTDHQVSKILDVPIKTLANWRSAGRGPRFIKISHHVRYRPADVKAFIDARIFKSTSEYSIFRARQEQTHKKLLLHQTRKA